jgi:molecular chaperone GrpE
MNKEAPVDVSSLNNEKKTKTSLDKKRLNKYLGEIKKLKQEKEELNEKLLRKVAEFDNYKRRTERDFLIRIQNAGEKLITELLTVLDDMERSIEHAKKHSEDVNSLIEGSELIYKKLLAILKKEGLESLNSVGENFDPEKHNALMQVESEEFESGKIIDEHLKGYELNGKVIRHSQVIVAK